MKAPKIYKINFGFGKDIFLSGKKAIEIEAEKKGGRFQWKKTITNRWRLFSNFCMSNEINDLRMISNATLQKYSDTMKDSLCPATKQNNISVVNTVMSLINARWEPVSPSKITKCRRSNIRITPISFLESDVKNAAFELEQLIGFHIAGAILCCFEFGLRRRESLLLEFHLAHKQVEENGYFDVIRGTKGGRGRAVPRFIKPRLQGEILLSKLCTEFPNSRCNLLNSTYKIQSNLVSNHALRILKKHGIDSLRELRVSYACRRYLEITGNDAPCCSNTSIADKEMDIKARSIIANELGHSRIEITNSYVGGSRYD